MWVCMLAVGLGRGDFPNQTRVLIFEQKERVTMGQKDESEEETQRRNNP